jgi:hypothetical protein
MKWKEGLAIAGALAGDRTGATRIPLDEENKKKNRKALSEAARIWHEGYMDGPNDNT